MPKWSHYLDDDFEDEFQKVERIRHKPKRPDEEKNSTKKKPSNRQDKQNTTEA